MTEPVLPGLDQADDDLEALASEPCPDCDYVATGKARGAGSAAWKLGLHRKNKHGVAGKKGAGKRKGLTEPTDEEYEAHPVVSSVKSVAAHVGRRKGTPSADDLANGAGRALTLGTLAFATYMAETDESIPEGPQGEAQRNELVDYLTMPQKAAADVMAPIGRAIAPTKLNARYGRAAVDNVDVVASCMELATYFMHIKRYLRIRAQGPGHVAPVLSIVPPAAPSTPTPAPVQPTVPAHLPVPMPGQPMQAPPPTPMSALAQAQAAGAQPPPFDGTLTSPAPQTGTVVDANMVQEMIRRRDMAAAAARHPSGKGRR